MYIFSFIFSSGNKMLENARIPSAIHHGRAPAVWFCLTETRLMLKCALIESISRSKRPTHSLFVNNDSGISTLISSLKDLQTSREISSKHYTYIHTIVIPELCGCCLYLINNHCAIAFDRSNLANDHCLRFKSIRPPISDLI